MATLTTVHNPFDPINSREIKEVQVGKPIYSVVDGFYCHFDVVVSLNGQITHDYEYVIQEEDHIGFVAVPSKGGGKNPFAMIAMVALAVAAPYAAGAVMGATAGMVGAGVYGGLSGALIFGGLQMGTMMIGGMLINSLMSPDMPSSTPTTSIASSPTYGWDNVQNQSAEGIALPIVYGKTKIVPPIISQYVETKDNKQYLNILYALNNGEITSVSDITINNNPITYFNDVTYEVRNGTNSQTLIPSFDNTRVDQSVGAKLSTTETIRRTSYNNVRGLTIIVSAPSGMYFANDKGGLDSRSVTLVVKYKKVGDATWTTIANTSISGATTSTIRQTFQADNIPAGEYDISITRTTAESTSTRTSDKVYFEGFTEIIYNDFTYPNTALLAIRALATDQLSGSMPSVSCVVDRGFGTSNPATASRNILELVGADVITTAFDEWATWCTSQNFTCNMVFDSEVNVRDALNIVGMLGRANVIQIGSEYMPIIDRVETMPVQRFLFTMGNIIRDSFKEEYLPLADRSNVVEVTYFDATLEYEKQSVEIFQYGFDESSDTVRKASVTLYGCTNRTQAVRHGRFLMNKNRYLTNTVSFEADVDAIACTIGDVINVSHDVPQWGYSGRVIDATVTDPLSWAYTQSTYVNGTLSDDTNTKLIQLDREVTLNASTVYQLVIRQHDDTIVTVAISTDTYTATDVLPVPLSVTIEDYDVFAFGETNRVTKLFRVISITRSSDQRRKISAIEYIPEVYDDALDEINVVNVSSLASVSGLLVVSSFMTDIKGISTSVVDLSWVGSGIGWSVYSRPLGATSWDFEGYTTHTSFRIDEVKAGNYQYRVGDIVKDVIVDELPLAPSLVGVAMHPRYTGVQFELTYDNLFDGFDHVEVWEASLAQTIDDAVLIGTTKSKVYQRYGMGITDSRNFWFRIVDVYGNVGLFYGAVVGTTTTNITTVMNDLKLQQGTPQYLPSLSDILIAGYVGGVQSIGISGNLFVDGTINGDKLVANTITGNQIAANSITAYHISSISVSSSSYRVFNSATPANTARLLLSYSAIGGSAGSGTSTFKVSLVSHLYGSGYLTNRCVLNANQVFNINLKIAFQRTSTTAATTVYVVVWSEDTNAYAFTLGVTHTLVAAGVAIGVYYDSVTMSVSAGQSLPNNFSIRMVLSSNATYYNSQSSINVLTQNIE